MAKTREKPKVKSTRTLTKRHEEVLNQILKALRTLDSKLTRKISRDSTRTASPIQLLTATPTPNAHISPSISR